MNTDLVPIENELTALAPQFEDVLAGTMPVDRLIRTVVVSCERLPRLLQCDRQSIMLSAMSAATLGLEVDGVTGQAFLIPFASRAQLVIGYKGFNTLAARSGYTITGDVVREGDEFEFEKGTSPFVRHKPVMRTSTDARPEYGGIIGAWACATHMERPPMVEVMSLDELLAIKGRSPGAKKSDSPWNDPKVGFPAMCAKTVKRRLARHMPLNVMQLAARLDEAHEEQGRFAYINRDRELQIEARAEASGTPAMDEIGPTETVKPNFDNLEQGSDEPQF